MIKCRVYLINGLRYYFYANTIDEAFECLKKFSFNDGDVDSITFTYLSEENKK